MSQNVCGTRSRGVERKEQYDAVDYRNWGNSGEEAKTVAKYSVDVYDVLNKVVAMGVEAADQARGDDADHNYYDREAEHDEDDEEDEHPQDRHLIHTKRTPPNLRAIRSGQETVKSRHIPDATFSAAEIGYTSS